LKDDPKFHHNNNASARTMMYEASLWKSYVNCLINLSRKFRIYILFYYEFTVSSNTNLSITFAWVRQSPEATRSASAQRPLCTKEREGIPTAKEVLLQQ
jgi:hypothetical protein